ncbi:hypothetical protein SDC9_118214 [bioreactor metagenome]|uniref:Uncharacterized protein n=1 Tax=bioreactor metagenome TaxID=1076179 RepID=A0A645C2S8_9ZZZZ
MSFINKIINTIGGWITVLAFIWSVCVWLYYNSIKVYLFINRIIKRRKEVFFDISFTYVVKKEIDFYKKLEPIIKEVYPKSNVKKEMNLTNNKIYNVQPYLIKVQQDDVINVNEEGQEIFIEIPKVRTTFSSVEKILDSVDLLDEKILEKIGVNSRKYCLTITFDKIKQNPFIYLVVRLFGKEAIEKFSCKLNCGILNEGLSNKTVDIYNDKIIITQSSFSDIRKLTPYLLLMKK